MCAYESEHVSRIASGRAISCDWGVGGWRWRYRRWKVKRSSAAVLKDVRPRYMVYKYIRLASIVRAGSLKTVGNNETGTSNIDIGATRAEQVRGCVHGSTVLLIKDARYAARCAYARRHDEAARARRYNASTANHVAPICETFIIVCSTRLPSARVICCCTNLLCRAARNMIETCALDEVYASSARVHTSFGTVCRGMETRKIQKSARRRINLVLGNDIPSTIRVRYG